MSLRFKTLAFVALGCLLMFADISMAQPGGGGGGRRGGQQGGFFGRGGGGTAGLLANPQIREELDLVDDQVEELEAMQKEMQDEMRSMFEGMRDMDPDERRGFMEDLREKMAEKTKEYEERYNGLLLPHQQKRLKQIQVQQGNRGGLENNDALVEELGLTEDQIAQMKEKAEEVNAKLQEKIAKLRAQAQDEIISVLSPEQQKKYKDLVGDIIELNNRNRQRQGQGRQQRPGSDF